MLRQVYVEIYRNYVCRFKCSQNFNNVVSQFDHIGQFVVIMFLDRQLLFKFYFILLICMYFDFVYMDKRWSEDRKNLDVK